MFLFFGIYLVDVSSSYLLCAWELGCPGFPAWELVKTLQFNLPKILKNPGLNESQNDIHMRTMVLEYESLQNWVIDGVHVGKYSSTMEHMGWILTSINP